MPMHKAGRRWRICSTLHLAHLQRRNRRNTVELDRLAADIELLNETQYEISLIGSPYTTLQPTVNVYYYYNSAVAARAGAVL